MSLSDTLNRGAVGWIGIGKMGGPMSRRVLAAGFDVTIFEPNVANRATVVAEGAMLAHDLEMLARAAEAVFLTIPDDAVLRSVICGPDGLAAQVGPRHVVVEMSTVSPRVSEEVAAALAPTGAAYLRAPVSGSTATAAAGALSVLLSGPREAFDRVLPVLAAVSQRQTWLGTGEEARYLKLVLNTLVGATSALLAEALTLGAKGNLSVAQMLEAIAGSAVASPLIAYKRDMLVERRFDAAFTVSQMMKDFDLILDAARDDHVPMFLTALIRQQYESAHAVGEADQDFFVLYEQYQRMAGTGKG